MHGFKKSIGKLYVVGNLGGGGVNLGYGERGGWIKESDSCPLIPSVLAFSIPKYRLSMLDGLSQRKDYCHMNPSLHPNSLQIL